MGRGKLIVIEGLDSVGKRTQCKLISERMKKEGMKVETISFPTYETRFGKLVRDYLDGKFGKKEEVSAEISSILYALDRYQHSEEIEGKLEKGISIIADRYSQSNAYQIAKVKEDEREELMKWQKNLESRLPPADAVVFLDMEVETARKLLNERAQSSGRKTDIHEKDENFQIEVRSVYLKEAQKEKWIVISCSEKGKLKNKEEIADRIYGALKEKRII